LSKIQELQTSLQEKRTFVTDFFDKKGEDDAISSEEKEAVMTANKEAEEIEHQLKDLLEVEGLRKKAADYKTPAGQPMFPNGEKPTQKQEAFIQKTWADEVLQDADFKAWHDEIAGKSMSDKVRIQSPAVEMKNLLTGASSTSAGAFVVNDRTGIYDAAFHRPITLLDLIPKMTTDSDTVEWVRQTTFTNDAAETAEATTVSNGEKPESDFAYAVVSTGVVNIAHWVPITRRALADAGQVRGYVENDLRYGIDERLEDQVYGGTGGTDLTGIEQTANTSTQAWDTDILKTTRKARTKVRTLGRATPNAYAMHPTDWETIDLLQDNEARYFFGGPSALGNPRLWGLPVVESEAITVGAGLCADFNMCRLWDRQQTIVMATDSHSDFFTRNIIVLLAEKRVAFGVIRPAAFVEVDLAQ
jgi:HK97 family phage major capsid protein